MNSQCFGFEDEVFALTVLQKYIGLFSRISAVPGTLNFQFRLKLRQCSYGIHNLEQLEFVRFIERTPLWAFLENVIKYTKVQNHPTQCIRHRKSEFPSSDLHMNGRNQILVYRIQYRTIAFWFRHCDEWNKNKSRAVSRDMLQPTSEWEKPNSIEWTSVQDTISYYCFLIQDIAMSETRIKVVC